MNGRERRWLKLICIAFLLGLATDAGAFYVDEKRTLQFRTRVQTRATFRLNDAEGFTNPDTEVGDLVQWRSLALVELDHDLRELTKTLPALQPLKKLKIRTKYHLVGRFMYEALYDVGSQAFKEVREDDRENIDSFKQAYDLWEFYVDFSRGPLFVRIGRQNLAWGETDIFRLLDLINPLDNTFGGPFEDLDDRRIPLWMLRASYNLGDIGPLTSVGIEGFWVPGSWDARVGPWAPDGTPYEIPLPAELIPFIRINTPDKSLSNSRWGARIQTMLGSNLNVSVAHYKTFLDLPTLRSVVVRDVPVLLELNDLELQATWPDLQITGASMSYWEPNIDFVFRGEVAWFWDEPVFIPEINTSTLFGPTLPLSPPVLDFMEDLLGLDIRDMGLDGLPLNPQSGSIPKKDILRYMFGFDKQIWIRPLNKVSTFFVTMQYFGQWVPEYDDRMRQAVPIYPDFVRYPKVKETESVFTAIVSTMYRGGTVVPQLAVAYDVRGAFLIQPSVNFIREPFRFMVQYSAIEGNFTNFGVFRDRDQISFMLSYLLN